MTIHNIALMPHSSVMYVIYCVLGLYGMNEWFRTLRSMYVGTYVMFSWKHVMYSLQQEEGHMTDTDALEQYLVAIETTHWRKLAQWEKEHVVRAMRLLAAEVRLLRERLAAQEPDATLGRLVREGELLK